MITLWNRAELTLTYSLEEQAKIRTALAQNNIDYTVKTVNRKSPSPFSAGSRARTGTAGEKLDLMYEYIFYVKKDDLSLAQSVLCQQNH